MKFFLDTADLDEIKEAASWGALAGVTTNPTLILVLAVSLPISMIILRAFARLWMAPSLLNPLR